MLKLKEWMARQGLNQVQAADLLGLSRSYLSEILSEKKPPGRKAMHKIADVTGGAVPLDAWYAGATTDAQG